MEVAGNPELGTHNQFCVAKYEMSNNAGDPASVPSVASWEVDRATAIAECQSLRFI
jgi:hypothetical protein